MEGEAKLLCCTILSTDLAQNRNDQLWERYRQTKTAIKVDDVVVVSLEHCIAVYFGGCIFARGLEIYLPVKLFQITVLCRGPQCLAIKQLEGKRTKRDVESGGINQVDKCAHNMHSKWYKLCCGV